MTIEMTRRGFIAATSAAILAGPRALGALFKRYARRDALIFSMDYPVQMVSYNRRFLMGERPGLVVWSQGVEDDYRDMMEPGWRQVDVRARSGFRAWSERMSDEEFNARRQEILRERIARMKAKHGAV